MSRVVETLDVHGRRVLDVSDLPTHSMGEREPVWWGNTLLMCIESMTVTLMLVTYFYIRRNFSDWPPPQPNVVPALFRPANLPDLTIPVIEVTLILLSILPMHLTNKAARRQDARGVKTGLWIMLLVSLAMTALRFLEMRTSHLKFSWDDNAYGSVIWTILGLHLTYLAGAAAEFFIILVWILRHGLDPGHGLDVTLMGYYWYWTAATWIACFATVYVGARVL